MQNFLNSVDNGNLAEEILNITETKFKEGVASSYDLTQKQTQFIEAHSKLVQAQFNLLKAKTAFVKSITLPPPIVKI